VSALGYVKSKIDKESEGLEVPNGKARTISGGDILMTADEVATYLRCHIVSLYRFLKRDSIPAFKVGGDWRFSRREIDVWMAGPFTTRPRRAKKSPGTEG
jgi:excisionase family DNA binding protein